MALAPASGFNRSLLKPLDDMPWRWTTPPDAFGNGGVKSAPLDGLFVLLDDTTINLLKTKLTAAEKTEITGWINRYSEAQCALWHVPLWAGDASAVYLRIPATEMADPTSAVTAKAARYFGEFYA